MQKQHIPAFRLAAAALLALALAPVPARAASKEIIELQTQVQQLLDMVQRLQSTMDARFGVLQHLTEQTADNANRVTAAFNDLQKKIGSQGDAGNAKLEVVSGQMQSLNDSVDEVKSRIAKLEKSIQDTQAQLQAMQPPAALPPGSTVPGAPGAGPAIPGAPPATMQNQAPPLQETFQAAVRDYNAAHYDVAAGEFQDVLHYYPLEDQAGTAQFYLGEIAYRQLNYIDAIKAYNALLEGWPGNAKAPAAQLRKALALMQTNKREAAIQELRSLIKRHPQTPEAAQARTKLNGMGVRVTAGR